MKKIGIGFLFILLAAGVVVLFNSLFTVHQTKQALVLQFGKPKRVIQEAGINFKLPFVQNVVFLDKRILDLDSPAQEVIASDRKRLVVDAFSRFRITDPLKFFQSVSNERRANSRLSTILNSSVRRVLGAATFTELVKDDRPKLMAQIQSQVNVEAAKFGIKIVDVRIKRADLPTANSEAIYKRMQTERQREASEFRAEGQEQSQRIRSTADKEVTVLKAEATRDAEKLRGQGDAQRNKIFAEAFGQDPEFFAFYRSMQAYENSLSGSDTSLVLSPDSNFFKYFKGANSARQ